MILSEEEKIKLRPMLLTMIEQTYHYKPAYGDPNKKSVIPVPHGYDGRVNLAVEDWIREVHWALGIPEIIVVEVLKSQSATSQNTPQFVDSDCGQTQCGS